MEKNVDCIHFEHFRQFFIIFMAHYPLEILMCTLFEGGGSKKVYDLYTHYGWLLITI